MIDLHLHTFYSDGTLSPTQLVKEAKSRGVHCMAITDHDGIAGLKEGIAASRSEGIPLICGIEFSAEYSAEADSGETFYFHLLGYGIDSDNRLLREKSQWLLQTRKERNMEMMKALQDKGFDIDWQDLKVHPQQTYVGKPNFARALVRKGYAFDTREAFQSEQMLHSPEIRQIHRVKIHAEDAIELIHQAGGKAVLAHPMKVTYRGKLNHDTEQYYHKLQQLVGSLQELGLDGMECYYSSHNQEQTERLLELADRKKLAVTAGSDFHGPEFDPQLTPGKFQVEIQTERLNWIEGLVRN